MKKLYGVITAMTTPFTADNKVDVAALEAQTEYLIQKGVQCLYPCGTTGEMYLMSAEERELVAETVVKKAAAAGAGLADTAKAALEGAKAGLEATKDMKPKYGKAAVFAAKALGTEDQGATAGMLLVQGLYDGIVK